MLSLLLVLSAAAAPCVAPYACKQRPDTLHRAALQAGLDAFGAAFLRADAEALDTLLAPDYVHTNGASGAVLGKTQWLEFIRSRRADLRSGRLRIDHYSASDQVIRWHAATAVVTSKVISRGVRDGVPFETRLRVTQVWIRAGSRWYRAAFHDSDA